MSNSLDPDQARHFVGPDLGSNCLQRLLADNKFADKELSINCIYPKCLSSVDWYQLAFG